MPLTPEQYTIIGMLVAIGVAGMAKKWVFGWVYDALAKAMNDRIAEDAKVLQDMTDDRNFWRDMALQSMGHTRKAIDAVMQQKNDP